MAKNTWGLSSEMTDMLYQSVIEPVLLYGVEAWCPVLRHDWAAGILDQAQRNCLLQISKGYRTISYDALRIITNIPLLSLKASPLANLSNVKRTGVFSINDVTIPVQSTICVYRHPACILHNIVNLNRSHINLNESIISICSCT